MTRPLGRCARGARLVAKVPQSRWRTLTFLAALRSDRIDAPRVIDGPINDTSFLAYVEQVLVPESNRMHQLLRQRRICFKIRRSRSSLRSRVFSY
jgi:hypothetical protein